MKKLNLKTLITASFFSFSYLLLAQTNTAKIWVTINDLEKVPFFENGRLLSTDSLIQNLIFDYNISSVKQALPSSRQQKLQNVYEISCDCNWIELSNKIDESIENMSAPQKAPEYDILNVPNDYSLTFTQDYALDLIKAQGAWEYSTGDTNLVIGISDANFYINHEELLNKVVAVEPNLTSTYYYHGTAVAITAAGHTNNGQGKSSIGFDCKLSLAGMGYNSILQLSYQGVKVINISWTSGCSDNTYVQNVIDEIYNNGTIVVVAAGNGSTCGGAWNLVYPAACEHVISVTSIGPTDNHEGIIGDSLSAHQHNNTVDLCAPGYNVALSIAPNSYLTGNGTSFAAPYVSGTIGLMLSLNPCLSFEEVLEILSTTAVSVDSLNPNYAGLLGAGRLDAASALKLTSQYICGQNNTFNDDNVLTDPENTAPNFASDGNDVNSTAGLTNFDQIKTNIRMYPNPSRGETSIKWLGYQNMILKIINVNGVIIEEINISESIQKISFNIEAKGIYFVQLTAENKEIWHSKLIKI